SMPHAKALRLPPPVCLKGKMWNADVLGCVSTCKDLKDCKKTTGYCVNGMCLCKPGLVMLPDETCALPCDRNECGSDAVCYKNSAGSNTCACNNGYTMTPLGCKEPCTVDKCRADAFCYKNAAGSDTCGCKDGYAMTPNNGCKDSCIVQNCGGNATYVKGTRDQAWCICKPGFRNVSGNCINICDLCGPNTICETNQQSGAKTCRCKDGYYMLPNGTCTATCIVTGCPIGFSCVGDVVEDMYCADNCYLKRCHYSAVCVKDTLSGKASCQCSTGFIMQSDGTCKDSCIVQNCGGNTTCVKGELGEASCICKQGFRNVSGACIDVCDLCDPNATCETDQQSGTKTCRCKDGYYMLPNNICAATCIVTGCAIGSSCVGNSTEDMYCAENCYLKQCHSSAVCAKDPVSGTASCQCSTGFIMQSDGTCKDPCDGVKCGPNFYCDFFGQCACKPDYNMLKDGTCTESCRIKTCGAGEECVDFGGDNGESVCRCLDGYVGEPGSCVDLCNHINCGPNSFCKAAICGCSDNYIMSPNSICAEKCTVNNCGSNAYCYKNATGSDMCSCNDGYTRTPNDGCADSCVVKGCGANTTCVKGNRDLAFCICKPGFRNVSGNCIDICDLCGPTATCETDQQSGTKTCRCNDGYYMLPNGTCAATCIVTGCPIGSSCVGDVAEDMYCADNCNFKQCQYMAVCVKDPVSGIASCECSKGYTKQSDGTCKDDCETMNCGYGGGCEHDPVTLEAKCICVWDDTFMLPNGTCIDTCWERWCWPPAVCRDNFTCACGDHTIGEPGSCLATCSHPDVNCSAEEDCIPPSMEKRTHAKCVCKDGYLRRETHVCAPTCKILADPYSPTPCGYLEECREDLPNGIAGSCECVAGYYRHNGECAEFLLDNCTADNCVNGNCVALYENWWWWNSNPPQYCKCNDGYTPDPVSGNCIESCPAMPCPYGYLCDTSGLYPVCKKVNCPADCPRDCVWNSQLSIQACPNTCEAMNCGPLEECAMVGGVPTCKCRSGYVGQPGSCAATCNALYCPPNQHCVEKVPGGAGTCECAAGYVARGKYCDATCAVYECGQNEVCEMVNLRPTCKCKPGYLGGPGWCNPPCSIRVCGLNEECVESEDTSYCRCKFGYMQTPYRTCAPQCIFTKCGPLERCIETDYGGQCVCREPEYKGTPPNCRGTCEAYPCNSETEVCVDKNDGAVCYCAKGYTRHNGICTGTCAVTQCDGTLCVNLDGIGTCPSTEECVELHCQDSSLISVESLIGVRA
ncbi:unnamed protein product, partial [Closterium sp. NIES-53]